MILKSIVLDDDNVQRELINDYISETDFLEFKGSFDNPVVARNFLEKNEIDLIFLDIELPKMNGLEFLESLTKRPKVVLCTSKEKYAVSSYLYEVNGYLLKPVTYSQFLTASNRVKVLLTKERKLNLIESKEIFVRSNAAIEKIVLTNILYIEAAVDYIEIVTTDNKYLVNSSMNMVLDRLPMMDFMRVHRSYIVRLDKIDRIDGNFIEVNQSVIKVSKTFRNELIQRINPL